MARAIPDHTLQPSMRGHDIDVPQAGEIVASTPIRIVSTRKPPRKIAILPIRSPPFRISGATTAATADRAVIVGRRPSALQRQKAQKNTDQIKEPRKRTT